jgi:hypothetical protein
LKADWVTDAMRNRGAKQLCRMKSEIGDLEMVEFVALRPKAYAYSLSDGKVEKRAKGVARAVCKRFNLKHYKSVLFAERCLVAEQTTILKFDYQLTTFTSRKTALSPYYDKAALVNAIDIVPYGYDLADDGCAFEETEEGEETDADTVVVSTDSDEEEYEESDEECEETDEESEESEEGEETDEESEEGEETDEETDEESEEEEESEESDAEW